VEVVGGSVCGEMWQTIESDSGGASSFGNLISCTGGQGVSQTYTTDSDGGWARI